MVKEKLYSQAEALNERIERRSKIKCNHTNYAFCPSYRQNNYPNRSECK